MEDEVNHEGICPKKIYSKEPEACGSNFYKIHIHHFHIFAIESLSWLSMQIANIKLDIFQPKLLLTEHYSALFI